MIIRIYELLTGRPWSITRSATVEFGPPPGAVYARELAGYSDLDLIRHGPQILAQLRSHTPTPTTVPAPRRPRVSL